ncbi:hypothetical protein OfM1_21680 [Lactovum odontotermitis]
MTISPLTDVRDYGWQSSGHFGGVRSPIDTIVLHHNAGTGSGVVPNCWIAREASAHYQIENGKIISCLDEEQVAWHCGAAGYDNNGHTIGIEHQNSTGAPNWLVSPENQEKSAQLVAEIAQRRGIPIDRDHIKRHREMPGCYTECSGGLDIDWIVARAQQIAGSGSQTNNGAGSAKGLIKMYLIFCTDTKRWYVSNGVEVRYVKTGRVLNNYQDKWAKLGLPTDTMYQAELDAEFGKNATDPNRDVSKG